MDTRVLEKVDIGICKSEVLVVIVKDINQDNFLILNCKMEDFLMTNFKYKTILLKNKSCDLRKIIKPYIKDFEYVVILQANTPLVSQRTLFSILDYVSIKQSKACKLPVGWVFNCEYLKHTKNISIDSFYSQNENEFREVLTENDRKYVEELMQKQIIDYHKSNGVVFKSENVLIAPMVDIKSGSEIYSNVSILGNTSVGRNCLIKENSIIKDSTICDNISISNSTIISSNIGDKSIIMPYCYIENSSIGKSVLLKSNKRIENLKIKNDMVVE